MATKSDDFNEKEEGEIDGEDDDDDDDDEEEEDEDEVALPPVSNTTSANNTKQTESKTSTRSGNDEKNGGVDGQDEGDDDDDDDAEDDDDDDEEDDEDDEEEDEEEEGDEEDDDEEDEDEQQQQQKPISTRKKTSDQSTTRKDSKKKAAPPSSTSNGPRKKQKISNDPPSSASTDKTKTDEEDEPDEEDDEEDGEEDDDDEEEEENDNENEEEAEDEDEEEEEEEEEDEGRQAGPESEGEPKSKAKEQTLVKTPSDKKLLENDNKLSLDQEHLVPIKIDYVVDNHSAHELLLWNLNEERITPEMFAENLCHDINSTSTQLQRNISVSIRRQLNNHLRTYLSSPAPPPGENLLTIKLNITIRGENLKDQFQWDAGNPANSPEAFARIMAAELSLPNDFQVAIAHSIRNQIFLGRRNPLPASFSSAVRPPDQLRYWTPTIEAASAAHKPSVPQRETRNSRRKNSERARTQIAAAMAADLEPSEDEMFSEPSGQVPSSTAAKRNRTPAAPLPAPPRAKSGQSGSSGGSTPRKRDRKKERERRRERERLKAEANGEMPQHWKDEPRHIRAINTPRGPGGRFLKKSAT
eukprot:TRINITY_DN1266_c3_g1_i1.p1 TRINITY_DN1266_c3_g1~~TRINITY_DN1266_c3_g1_i1.p1  ORF type:complete len:583 (+),score=263.27 TRINITY_DN1266_c3_g1_i1:10-1758(+)